MGSATIVYDEGARNTVSHIHQLHLVSRDVHDSGKYETIPSREEKYLKPVNDGLNNNNPEEVERTHNPPSQFDEGCRFLYTSASKKPKLR